MKVTLEISRLAVTTQQEELEGHHPSARDFGTLIGQCLDHFGYGIAGVCAAILNAADHCSDAERGDLLEKFLDAGAAYYDAVGVRA